MSTKEVLDLINTKMEEIYQICEKHDMPMLAVVFSQEIQDASVFMGGKHVFLPMMISELIANVVEDMKLLKEPGSTLTTRSLVSLFMGDVAENLEGYLANEDSRRPDINEAMVNLTDKIQKEIDEKLRSMMLNKEATPELRQNVKKEVTKILAQYSLDEKIVFDIKVMPDGKAEVSFMSKKKAEGLN